MPNEAATLNGENKSYKVLLILELLSLRMLVSAYKEMASSLV